MNPCSDYLGEGITLGKGLPLGRGYLGGFTWGVASKQFGFGLNKGAKDLGHSFVKIVIYCLLSYLQKKIGFLIYY